MPELVTDFIRFQLKALKPIFESDKISTSRNAQDKIGLLMAKVHASKVSCEENSFPLFNACTAIPKGRIKKGVILYLHGGGYVAGSLPYASGFGSVLADRLKRKVLCPAYRLAPENPFPAALEDAFASYVYLTENGYQSKDIILCGDSAGGGLVFALCLMLKQKGFSLPAGIVAISPWTDLTLASNTIFEKEKDDPCLTPERLNFFANCYCGRDKRYAERTNPLVSPLFGDLSSLPPSLIFVGEDEILLGDSMEINKRLLAANCKSTLIMDKKMWHGYVMFGIKESQIALKLISGFIKKLLK